MCNSEYLSPVSLSSVTTQASGGSFPDFRSFTAAATFAPEV